MLALLLAAGTVFNPPTPRPTPPPGPPPALDTLAAFEGTWSCESAPAEEGAPPAVRTQMTIARELDAYWYAGRVVETSIEKKDVRPVTRLFFWSYDFTLGKFVGGWLDSRGGWSAQTSPDWQDDTLVFLGHVTASGEKVTARETFTRPKDGAFTRRYEVLQYVEWVRVREETCRKQP
jgi:hypothetical protein